MCTMKRDVIIAQLGRIFIIIAILLSVINAFYWKNNIIDAVSVIFAFLSLVMVLYVSRNFRKDLLSGNLNSAFNQQAAQDQLFNLVYKSTIENNFESLPMSVEQQVKETMPYVSIDQLLKVYDYMLTIPKEMNIFYYNQHFNSQKNLNESAPLIKAWIKTNFYWMNDENLDLSFNYFFKQ